MENRLTRTPLRRVAVAFAPAVLLLVLVTVLAFEYWLARTTRVDVGRSREAALAAERVFSNLKDAESGNRGFLLIGDERYLAPYHAALARLRADTAALRELVAGDPDQVQRLDSLAVLVDARLTLLARGIELRRAGQLETATIIVREGSGMAYMQGVRELMTAMIAHERAHTQESFAVEERSARTLIALFLIGVPLLFALGYMGNRALLRFAAARAAATQQIRKQHELAQEQALELEIQRDQLQEQNTELELQQDELQRQAVEMEMQQEELQRQAVEMEMQQEELHTRATELEELNARLQQTNAALDAARHEAEQANRAKSQFLAAMSHELRTPLNAIGGYVDLVEAGVYGTLSEGQIDAMARVKSNQQHLLAIINDILSYAGIAAGNLRVNPQDIAVSQLIGEIEQIIHPVARERGLALMIEAMEPDGAIIANADPARVRQILVNLLANAVKFTPSGGSITVAYRQTADAVEIDVRDTGRGIPEDKLAAIFEPFVQLDRNAPEQSGRGGLGLGLALSRELARSMDGDITVRSTVGAGSVFTLSVPRAVVPAPSDGVHVRSAQLHREARAAESAD